MEKPAVSAISTKTRTFSGKSNSNPELKLRPRMFVKSDVITDRKENAVVIPKDIIMSGGQNKYVFVVGRNLSANSRWITTGMKIRTWWR